MSPATIVKLRRLKIKKGNGKQNIFSKLKINILRKIATKNINFLLKEKLFEAY